MNPEILLQHFDRISEAPDAVIKFRQFILELAVRGKLVEQDPNDEPVLLLLKCIQDEKNKRIKSGHIKKQEPLPQVRPNEMWFSAPTNWQWERLGTITQILMGQSPPGDTYNKSGDGVPLINGPVEFTEGPFGITTINQYTTAPTNMCEEGDLLLCVRGSTTGRTNIAGFTACIGRGVAAIRPFFSDRYVRLFVWRLRASIIAMGRGIAFPSVSRQQIEELPIPLPPLAEQHRIVAKVDELMALCDQLQAERNKREIRRNRLVASSLNRISTATAEEAKNAARFHLNHLPRLTTRTEHIKQLRQSILNLAVRGRLVPQDPNDEPAAELLKRVELERKVLVSSGRIRKEKPLSPISTDKWPFMISDTWKWAMIGDAALFTEYGTSQQSHHTESGVPVLKMGDIQDGKLLLGGQKKVPLTIDDLPTLYLHKYDLLYNRTNSADLVGKTGIYLGNDNEYTFASYLIRIRCSNVSMNPSYFNLSMNSPYFRETQIIPHLKQQCGQANVNGTILKNMLVPIPPLAEQHRIVAKVDELMALCDQLETNLNTTEADSRRLLEAVLRDALEPAMKEAA